MKKKNGFVFMETIVVVSVLSLTLLILFTSYSFILRKSRERNTFDTTETIYKTYYVKQIIDGIKPPSNPSTGVKYYIDTHKKSNGGECSQMGTYNSFVCDLSSDSYTGNLIQIKKAYEVDKFYLVNPRELLKSTNKEAWLNMFDATTIDYIHSLGESVDYDVLIVKYKKRFNKDNGEYEIIHSSMEVTS